MKKPVKIIIVVIGIMLGIIIIAAAVFIINSMSA